MKKIFSSLTVAAALASATTAFAAPVNIGGLNFPSDGGVFAVTSIYENVITSVGDTLRGVGEVSQINGQNISTLCSGCELTFRFDNYVVTSISSTEVRFTGGEVRFFLDFGGADFNPFASPSSAVDLAAATDGTLFLTLSGHPVDAMGNTFIGQGTNIGTTAAVGTGSGLADVVPGGGIASSHFDTNSITAVFGGPADFQIGSSFSNAFLPHPQECPGGPECLAGSADLRGLLVVPEPGSVSLLGLALLGAYASTKRRRG